MNATFNQVDFIHTPEREGIARGAAEAIARGIEDRNRALSTKDDLDGLSVNLSCEIEKLRVQIGGEIEKLATKAELQMALARQTIQVGAMVAGGVALATSIIGTIIALK